MYWCTGSEIQTANAKGTACGAFFTYLPGGIPVGCMTPNFHAMSMQANSRMEIPTRIPNARAMRLDFSDLLATFCPPRIMNTSAKARLPRMAAKASATRYDMDRIIT
jgi:hypothetical protein